MQFSKNIANGPKTNDYVLVGIRVIVCIQNASRQFLQAFGSMFKIVFRDFSLYPKQMCLFCLAWLMSASADNIGYITKFCCVIELLHELKNSSCQHSSIQAFDNVSAGKKEN